VISGFRRDVNEIFSLLGYYAASNVNPSTLRNNPNPSTLSNNPNPSTLRNNPNPSTLRNNPNPSTPRNNPNPSTLRNNPEDRRSHFVTLFTQHTVSSFRAEES
jgi:hypothetical protein